MGKIIAPWSEAEKNLAKEHWMQGDSAASISRELAHSLGARRSRNSVIGMLHRAGLAGQHTQPTRSTTRARLRKDPSPRPRSTSPRINRVEQAARLSAELARIAALPPIDPTLGIERLNAFTCHYPIGDPKDADFAYCGRTCSKGVWCAEHHRLVYRPDSVQSLKRTESAAGWAARKDQGGQYIAGFGA